MRAYNYRYIVADRKVIALSTYAGKNVRGIAVCAPEDEFDLDKGKEIARLRCAQKIAKKRLARAERKIKEAADEANNAINHYNNMVDYYKAASEGLNDANVNLDMALGV